MNSSLKATKGLETKRRTKSAELKCRGCPRLKYTLCVATAVLGVFLASCEEETTENPLSLLDTNPSVQAMNTFLPALGKGVNLSETDTFGVCVVGSTAEEARGFDNRLYHEKLVKSKSELNDAMDVSASASARGLFFSGSAEASYFKNVDFHSDSIYWLVDSKYVLGHEHLDLGNAHLSDAAKSILARDDGLEAFTRACGDRFYSSVQKGARYSLLYDFHGDERKTLESIRAKASGAGFGISASAEFNSLIAAASSAQYLSIHSHIQGGGANIAEHAENAEHLKEQLQTLRDDVLVRGQGVNLSWYASSYEAFPEFQAAKSRARRRAELPPTVDELHRDGVLSYLYKMHSENRSAIEDVQRFHARVNNADALMTMSSQDFVKGQQMLQALQVQNDQIAQRSRRCLQASQDSDCSAGDLVTLLDPSDTSWRGVGVGHLVDGFNNWSTSWLEDPATNPSRLSLLARGACLGSPPGEETFKIVPLYNIFLSPAKSGNRNLVNVRITSNGRDFEMAVGQEQEIKDPQTGRVNVDLCRGRFEKTCAVRLLPLPSGIRIHLIVFDDNGFPFPDTFTFESQD